MTSPDLQTQIAAAEAYEKLFVASLFQEWVPHVIAAARLRTGDRVLDVACGTGVLARGAAQAVGSQGAVVGLDASSGMLAVARRLAPSIEWREGKAESLPFPDASFDAVISQFGLMFFSDPVQAIREMRRVLKPDGRMAVAVWDTLENNPAYAEEAKLLDKVRSRQAGDALRPSFKLGDKQVLETVFHTAGVREMAINTMKGTANFPSTRTMVEADLRGWLPLCGVLLSEAEIQQTLDEAEKVLAPYTTRDGRAVFSVSAHIVSAQMNAN